MLDYDTAIELMKKYGYSSTTTHPYIYQNGDSIGICYTYDDEDFGELERIRIFEDKESFEFFLKQLDFVKKNGRNYHIRMVLDNYESTNPKVLFLRNEKLMVEGEMFDIESFDYREMQRDQMDDVSKIIYEAGDLLLIYDEIKGRQLQYLKNIVNLKNTLREKYFELQKEVDLYNKYKVERHLTLLSDVSDIGINDSMEISIKDKYNLYVVQLPTYEEAVDFLKEVWDLNKNLELNTKYYEAQKEEADTRNELKVVERKLELMNKLNEDLRPLFGVDLVSKFRKINKLCSEESNTMSSEVILENINRTARKYSVYDSLDLLYTSDYLREAIQNTNYADLAIKYSKGANKEFLRSFRIPPNEVAASLSVQYRDKLDVNEQAILVIYNNHKYRKLCNVILEIEDFENTPVKRIINKIGLISGFSKIKSECYDAVKRRLEDPCNATIKQSLFSNFDFTTFESFITSLIKELIRLRNVNNKMILSGDINMYLMVKKPDDITGKKFVMVTNDLKSLLALTKENNSMIGITLLKKHTPVLYSPYYLDIGDIFSKDASLQMSIKEMINFELLVEISDIIINIDPVKTNVVRYYSNPVVVENVSVVDDIKKSFKTTFCKFAFTNGLGESIPDITHTTVNNGDVSIPQSSMEASVPVTENVNVVSNVPVDNQNIPVTEPVLEQSVVTQPVVEQPVPVAPVDLNETQSNNIGENVTTEVNEENKDISLPEETKVEEVNTSISDEKVKEEIDKPLNVEENKIDDKETEEKEIPVIDSSSEDVVLPKVEEHKDVNTESTESKEDSTNSEEKKEIPVIEKDTSKNIDNPVNVNSQKKVIKVGVPNKPVSQKIIVNGNKPVIGKVVVKQNVSQPTKDIKLGVSTNNMANKIVNNSVPKPSQIGVSVKKEVKVVGAIGKPVRKPVAKIGQPVKPGNIENK